jgi:hypothetical protein
MKVEVQMETKPITSGKSRVLLGGLTLAELRLACNAQRQLLLERASRGLDPDARSIWNFMRIAALLRVGVAA